MKLAFLLKYKCLGVKNMTSLICVKTPAVLSTVAFVLVQMLTK